MTRKGIKYNVNGFGVSYMDKKTFFKGFAAGIAVSVAVSAAVGAGFAFKSGLITAGNTGQMTTESKVGYIETLLERMYVDDVDEEKMNNAMFKAMVESLGDKYTEYFTADEFRTYMEQSQGSFYGIGVTVTEDKGTPGILVVEVFEDSPAEKAGIKAGDHIIGVDGTDVSDFTLDAAVTLMRGEKDTGVNITVKRGDETLDFTMVRDEVNSITVAGTVIDDIGYIRIAGFKKNTYNEFKKVYDELTAQNIKGMVLDLRNNPGGLFDVCGKIADVLVGEGVYVYTVDKSGKKVEYKSDANCINMPLYVLVNGMSASASEILAGAVQDMGYGKLIGETTYGKGLVQGIFSVPDGSGVKITIQKYYTPRGVCIQGEGIAPDYEVHLPEGYTYYGAIDLENDSQLNKAIELIHEN